MLCTSVNDNTSVCVCVREREREREREEKKRKERETSNYPVNYNGTQMLYIYVSIYVMLNVIHEVDSRFFLY